ncbi:hypothetical protein HAX54_002111, partial [Datura stramonium]|nr:hypothetical protein [Datura stramonium]
MEVETKQNGRKIGNHNRQEVIEVEDNSDEGKQQEKLASESTHGDVTKEAHKRHGKEGKSDEGEEESLFNNINQIAKDVGLSSKLIDLNVEGLHFAQ